MTAFYPHTGYDPFDCCNERVELSRDNPFARRLLADADAGKPAEKRSGRGRLPKGAPIPSSMSDPVFHEKGSTL